MADKINLLNRVASIDVAPEFAAYSKVIIYVDDDTAIVVGDDSGRTLEVTNPFGTQAMAQRMLASLRGYQYQPLYATSALLDPAAEIGDGVSIKNIYGGIYQRTRTFNQLMAADIAAPHEEEINHEYKYVSPQERRYKREMGDVRATLSIESDRITAEIEDRTQDSAEFRSRLDIQATQIAARVTQTGGSQSSFGWSLLSNEFGLYAGNTKVFWVNSSGAHVKGEITATSGKIGNFNIKDKAIWNNISQYGGTQTTGVYLGTDGIQLGQRFKVDTYGNVTASQLVLTGGSIDLGNGAFHVYSNGAVSASNLVIRGGSINLGNGVFQVSNTGAVTASNLSINGGAININNGAFYVDRQGNLTAKSGTFQGSVYAKNIQSGGSYGTFNAGGLTDGTISSLKYGEGSIGSTAIGSNAVITGKIADSAVSYDKVEFTATLDQVGTNASNITSLGTSLADKRSITNFNFDELYLLKEGSYHSLYADYISIGGSTKKMVFWN